MNRQEALDQVYEHFVTRGNPLGVNEIGGCVYLNKETGAMCAIGLLASKCGVPGDRLIELAAYISGCPDVVEAIGVDKEFLEKLQFCHDWWSDNPDADRAKSLLKLAEEYGLTIGDNGIA